VTIASDQFAEQVAPLRPGLLLHCYRMLGSSHDAEDAVQETLLRGWRGVDRFEGRSSLRTWLYTVATNVCLREIERRGRRLVPVDLGPAADPADGMAAPITETVWLGPLPDAGITWESTPTDAVYEQKEAVELAFIAALQGLPALQRAVLVLRDVLAFSAAETAEILETTVASVTSALARARGSVKAALPERSQQEVLREVGDRQVRATVSAFIAAWERSDVDAVVALLAEDVEMSMPPYAEWYRGRADVRAFIAERPLRPGRRWRGQPVWVNGQPGVEFSVWDERVGAFLSHGVSVFSFGAGGITAFTTFLDPRFVAAYG
jgi:RNA polymerase sigma-70 factor (ECF subfamily)